MHIVDMVYFWARTSPRRPAVIEPAGSMTYAAFAHAVEAAAEHFAQNIADKPRPVAVSIQTGSNMLVYERDGVTLDGGTNILFDENWQSFGTKAETENRPLPRSRTEGGNILC